MYLNFKNTFSRLPDPFFSKIDFNHIIENPQLLHLNSQGCDLLNINKNLLNINEFTQYFTGSKLLSGSLPLSMAYSGHQFGVWAGRLGDGRAVLLGQVRNDNHELWDVQLKGCGLTPYSRMGDGFAVLRSSIREYIAGEFMHALGIPSTRSLCLIATNQLVYREKPEMGAIITRLSNSHIRFGHFEHFYYNNDWNNLQRLTDYTIETHFPSLKNHYSLWLAEVFKRTAHTTAQWMAYGFCHGVMNTDNMSIMGLTLDYGPYSFLEQFKPDYICNHTDSLGRYAYNQQPAIALWNCQALAHALQPIIPLEESEQILKIFTLEFQQKYHSLMCKRLALNKPNKVNNQLWNDLLNLMKEDSTDYHLTFSSLASALKKPTNWLQLFIQQDKAQNWFQQYKETLTINEDNITRVQTKLQKTNPNFVLRNWVAESVIREAEDHKNYQALEDIMMLLQSPFDKHSDKFKCYTQTAPKEMQNLSLSCSS